MKHLVIIPTVLLIWGAFWVNLPLGNYLWVAYDVAFAIGLPVLVYRIL